MHSYIGIRAFKLASVYRKPICFVYILKAVSANSGAACTIVVLRPPRCNTQRGDVARTVGGVACTIAVLQALHCALLVVQRQPGVGGTPCLDDVNGC